VHYDRYAFDLSRFTSNSKSVTYAVRERDLIDLANPDPADPVYQREARLFRSEFHDRILLPVYPLAFAVIVFAYLGAPRTIRQNRVAAMTGMIAAVVTLRFAGFVSMVWGTIEPLALLLQYFAFAAAFALGLRAIARGKAIEPPAFLTRFASAASGRFSHRLAVP
jgi:lipopolysaccharide export system permease protein